MNAEDPLFILYTSGSTGKPKGVLHTTGGYLVYASYTHEVVFDLREDDIYWCTADVGWVTGHSYIVYGPLANGATALVFEGVPNYPSVSRFWEVIDKPPGHDLLHRADRDPRADARRRRAGQEDLARVAAPARHGRRADQSRSLALVLRSGRRLALPDRRHLVADRDRRHPDHAAGRRDRPQARFGHASRSSACSRRWSTPTASAWKAKPRATWCCATRGRARCAPSTATIRASSTPISRTYPGNYFTGDGCRRDADGYYWITGRVDDVINVSGHRIGTAEVESALVSHPKVAEAAVVGFPHDIKGQGIYAYVTLIAGEAPTDDLRKELVAHGCARRSARSPRPTTCNGRRACRRRARARSCAASCARSPRTRPDQLGDTSTLADPGVVESLVKERRVP